VVSFSASADSFLYVKEIVSTKSGQLQRLLLLPNRAKARAKAKARECGSDLRVPTGQWRGSRDDVFTFYPTGIFPSLNRPQYVVVWPQTKRPSRVLNREVIQRRPTLEDFLFCGYPVYQRPRKNRTFVIA
jgi:hypothetical protein